MRNAIAKMSLVLVAGFAMAGQPALAAPRAAKPQINLCPDLEPLEEGQIGRLKPVDVPRAFARMIRATRDRLAVSTLGGSTICIDMRIKHEVTDFVLTPDNRFFSFGWSGYEASGYVMIDRTGSGQEVDTGIPPVFSPSKRRFASVHQSESAFADLEGLGVWELAPEGLRQIARVGEIPEMLDWKIDGWVGEECLNLSAVPFSRAPEGATTFLGILRDRFVARPAGRVWRVAKVGGAIRAC
jgi:hypothetical protein